MRLTILRPLSTRNAPLFGRYPILDPCSSMTTYPDPRPVPESILRPIYVPNNFFTAPWGYHDEVTLETGMKKPHNRLTLGGQDETDVRVVAKMAAEVLQRIQRVVKPGVTTNDLDKAVHGMIVSRGAYPSPLGYSSFPRSCTTSVNNVIAHGVPDDRPLDPQDIINIDVTLYFNGFHGDTSATFMLPDVDSSGRELVEATREALEVGIAACGPGMPLNGIGQAIAKFAGKNGLSVNEQFSGHGIGRRFHQPPWIVHHRNTEPGVMKVGDCFTIEPALVQGTNSRGSMWDDGWTMSTDSGARSAQFEHQVLITDDGIDVLTRSCP